MSSVPLQKPTEEMTLREIVEYVSPHCTEDAKNADYRMIRLEFAKAFTQMFQDDPDYCLQVLKEADKWFDLVHRQDYEDVAMAGWQAVKRMVALQKACEDSNILYAELPEEVAEAVDYFDEYVPESLKK